MGNKPFKALVIAGLLVGLLTGIIGAIYNSDYSNLSKSGNLLSDFPIVAPILFVNSIVSLISYILLLFYNNFARYIFVATQILAIFFTAFEAKTVIIGVETALSEITFIVSGLIIGVIFFSDQKQRFIGKQ